MIRQCFDLDAGALYVELSGAKVARTVAVDSGTLADLDRDGNVAGIEVIQPERSWPLEEILRRFGVADATAAELRACFPRSLKVHVAPDHPALIPARTLAQPVHPGAGLRVTVSPGEAS